MKRKISVIQRTKNILEVVSFLVMAASYVFFAFIYYRYPTGHEIPSPVFAWRIDSVRAELFTPFAICSGIFIFLFMLYRFPGFYRYPQEITAQNIERQYHLAKIMLSTEIIITGVFFAVIYTIMYMSAVSEDFSSAIIPAIVFPISAATVYLIYLYQARKKRTVHS